MVYEGSPLDGIYKNLYTPFMTSKGSQSRIKWEGDSNQVIRTWPQEVRQNFGGELSRLENHEEPLDSKAMGKSLPGVHELRDEDRHAWYRLLYHLHSGWIYVLHCFKKKSNQTSMGDIGIARQRLSIIKQRADYLLRRKNEESKSEERIR
jgi:phage-related protein